MGKNKLRKFEENSKFNNLFQPKTEDVLNKDFELKGKWHEVFGNSNPITLELGCGKGEYTVAMAKKYPDRNFIGIDIKGARLWLGAKTINTEKITNAAFLRTRIDFIESCFSKNEISEIWITFPDPFKEAARAKRRLTSSKFLSRYKNLLKADGYINLKTDSRLLHEYTKALVNDNKLRLLESCTDIHTEYPDNDLFNIVTYYESLFLKERIPITYLKFCLDSDTSIIEPTSFDNAAWLTN